MLLKRAVADEKAGTVRSRQIAERAAHEVTLRSRSNQRDTGIRVLCQDRMVIMTSNQTGISAVVKDKSLREWLG